MKNLQGPQPQTPTLDEILEDSDRDSENQDRGVPVQNVRPDVLDTFDVLVANRNDDDPDVRVVVQNVEAEVHVSEQNLEPDVSETVNVLPAEQNVVEPDVRDTVEQTADPDIVESLAPEQTSNPETVAEPIHEQNVENPDVPETFDAPASGQQPEAICVPYVPELFGDVPNMQQKLQALPDIQQNVRALPAISEELFTDIPSLIHNVSGHIPKEPVQQEHNAMPHGSGMVNVSAIQCDDEVFLKFNCTECPRTFSSYTQLADHTEVHVRIKDGPYECHTCGEDFQYAGQLSLHISLRHEELDCDVCGKSFKHKSSLEKHFKLHKSVRKEPNLARYAKTYSKKRKSKSPEPGSSSKKTSEAGPSRKRTRASRKEAEPGQNVPKAKPKAKKGYHANMKTYSRKK